MIPLRTEREGVDTTAAAAIYYALMSADRWKDDELDEREPLSVVNAIQRQFMSHKYASFTPDFLDI